MITAGNITDEMLVRLTALARISNDRELIRAAIAAQSTTDIVVSAWTKETARERCANAINDFAAGARACRAMLAMFVESSGHPDIAASIRANWSPLWGVDPDAQLPTIEQATRGEK